MAATTKKPPPFKKGAHPPSTPLEKEMVGTMKKFGLKNITAQKGKPAK